MLCGDTTDDSACAPPSSGMAMPELARIPPSEISIGRIWPYGNTSRTASKLTVYRHDCLIACMLACAWMRMRMRAPASKPTMWLTSGSGTAIWTLRSMFLGQRWHSQHARVKRARMTYSFPPGTIAPIQGIELNSLRRTQSFDSYP
jgi:hypothetical protein